MLVTHIIGNGFDINQGLETSYRDFYTKYYLNQASNSLLIDDLKKEIENNINTWSDLELQIGRYTSKITTIDELSTIISDLQEKLADYIEGIENLDFDYDLKQVEQIKRDLIFPYHHLKNSEQELFGAYKNNHGAAEKVAVLSFNYTSTLEKILRLGNNKIIGGDRTRDVFFDGIKYIHNSINDKRNIILGVDNVGQIDNVTFRDETVACLYLVKPFLNQQIGNLNDRECKKIISQSDVISIFGVSLGDTDQTWWNEIGKTINKNDKRLIYFHYDDSVGENAMRRLQREMTFKNALAKKMGIDDSNTQKVFVKFHNGNDIFKKAIVTKN